MTKPNLISVSETKQTDFTFLYNCRILNHLCFQKEEDLNVQKSKVLQFQIKKKHTCEVDIVLVREVPQLEMVAEELARGDPPEPG